MNTRKLSTLMAACAVAAAFTLAGCSSGNGNDTASTAGAQGVHGTIKLAYVEWDSCVAATNVAQVVLEKAGYEVQTVSVTAAMMYEGLATQDVDAMMCAWLPHTHAQYYAKTKDKLVNLGPNMDSASLGLVVPDYVKITSIPQLADADVAKKFKDRIVGIDPGAGIMALTQKVVKAYKLPEKLVAGSGATMTAALANSIRLHEPIAVTGWKPHWMWARYKLRYLKDPKDVYGKPDHIDTLVRIGLKQDQPTAYKILDAIHMGAKQRGEVMVMDRKQGADLKADAQKWVADHGKLVSRWLDSTS